jgi:hypothetical protein
MTPVSPYQAGQAFQVCAKPPQRAVRAVERTPPLPASTRIPNPLVATVLCARIPRSCDRLPA